jgi:hypothetical protein
MVTGIEAALAARLKGARYLTNLSNLLAQIRKSRRSRMN